jgi:hypothetical protein
MPVSVRSRKFCCFLPVRFGVFVLSLVAMVGGSFVAAVGWIKVSQINQKPIDRNEEIALWIQSSVFTLLAVLAVFGFLGVMIKSRGMVSSFASGLAIHFGISLASGIFALVSLFKVDGEETVKKCLEASTDATEDSCKQGVAVMKGLMVGIYVITWIIQLYAYFIVERYADQLDDEELAKNTVVIPRALQEVSGAPHVTTYSAFVAPAPYHFTESQQAFGAHRRDPSNNV